MEWQQFASVYAQIGPVVNAAVDALVAALQGWIRPWLQGGLLLYIVGRLLWGAVKRDMEPFSKAEEILVTGAAAITFATSTAWFGPYVRDLVMVQWIQGAGNAIAGTTSGGTLSAAMFDDAWNKAWVAGLAFYNNIPWSMAGVGLIAILLLFWVVAACAIALGFLIWLKATTFASLLLGVGPIFVGLFAFPWTRPMFFGWLNTLLANVVLSVLSVALTVLLLTAQTRVITLILADVQTASGGGFLGGWLQPAANEFVQAKMLLGGAIISGICGWLALQLPGTAASIAHGFAGYGHFATGLAGFWGGSRTAEEMDAGARPEAPQQPPAAGPQPGPAPAPRPAPPGPSLSHQRAAHPAPAAPTPAVRTP